MFKKGEGVKLVQPVIEGNIIALAIVDDVVQYLVEYMDGGGDIQQRYFTEAQLELAP